jgi:hypothetical protein
MAGNAIEHRHHRMTMALVRRILIQDSRGATDRETNMERRDFLRLASGAAIALAAGPWPDGPAAAAENDQPAGKNAPDTSPLTFWVSQPVKPGQAVMLRGAGYGPDAAVLAARLADGEPGSPLQAVAPQAPTRKIKPLQATDSVLQFVIPENTPEGVYACAIRANGQTGPVSLVNAPDVWFIQGDCGDTASPGGWIGVFGTCISIPSGQAARLALVAGGKVARTVIARPAGGTRYGQYFDVPAEMPTGIYTLYAHNGHGGPAAWTRYSGYANEPILTFTIAPRQAWPTTVFEVAHEDGATDDEKMAGAIARAEASGGGIITLPAGTFKLARTLALPHRTLLRGAGIEKSVLQWITDPTDANGRPAPLVRGAEVSSQAGGGRGSFSLEDLSLLAAPTMGACIVERTAASEPAHFRRVRLQAPRQKNEQEGRPAIQLSYTRNLEISGCDIDGFTCIAVDYASGSYLCITENRLRWRGATLMLHRDHHNIIVEKNHLIMAGTFTGNGYTRAQNPNPGLWFDSFDSSNVRDLYYASNTSAREEAEPPDPCIGITFDGNNGAYWGRVLAVDGTHMTLAAPTRDGDRYGHPPCQPGAFVRIVAGRGMGQWRYLASRKTIRVTEIEVDRPWDIQPDANSWLAISNFQGRTLFIGNDFGNEPCLQTYFGSNDIIWAENQIGVEGTHTTMPVWVGAIAGGMESGWNYQVLDNRITRLGADMTTIIASFGPTPAGYPGPITCGHVYRNNRASDPGVPFVIHVPSRTNGLLIEGNQGLSALQTKGTTATRGVIRANTNAMGEPLKPTAPAGVDVLVTE